MVGPSDDGDSLSKLWLCQRHADSTELKQLRRREQAMVAAVSRLAQWYWHDGHTSHAYGHACNTQLESAFRCGDGVGVSVGTVHTVRLRASPMRVVESGVAVVRISAESCVAYAMEVYGVVRCRFTVLPLPCRRHCFPGHGRFRRTPTSLSRSSEMVTSLRKSSDSCKSLCQEPPWFLLLGKRAVGYHLAVYGCSCFHALMAWMWLCQCSQPIPVAKIRTTS